jgi:hypothetical protein
MIKRIIAGLLAIFCVAAGYSSGRDHYVEAKSRATALPSKTVQVRLVQVETNADLIDSPVADSNITIQAGAARFNQRTNKNGVALFDAVPCGGEIVITVHGEESTETAVFHRGLACQGKTVSLGVITNPFGGHPMFEQRRTRFIGYDATRQVWRTEDGRIVPNREIRRLLARYRIMG